VERAGALPRYGPLPAIIICESTMAPRPYWRGYLRLSLVTCPVLLYPATTQAEKTHFHQINKRTGNRLHQQMIDEKTGKVVDKDEKGRGYELSKGKYVEIEEDELEAIQIESTHTIDIQSFVKRDEVDDRYLDSAYYMAPTDQVGQEAFAVIRDTARDKKMVALGRIVLARREHIVMLEPFDKGILAVTLRYAYEVREPAAYFEDMPDLKLPGEMKELAAYIVDQKTAKFDPAAFEDQYETALVAMLRAKQTGQMIETKTEKAPQRVINLMDALRASIGQDTKKKPAAASAKERAGAARAPAAKKKARR
jgi:Ku protein